MYTCNGILFNHDAEEAERLLLKLHDALLILHKV